MMNKKSTKKALFMSTMSLLLCLSMLIGTTFAWFTDSVSSTNNIIKAGNLDVELEYLVDGKWEKVNSNTNVFEENTLWEPGHTEVVYLKISNAGSLALKYALNINVASEIESVNVAGDLLRLSDYIKYDVIEGVESAYATRDEARKAAEDDTSFLAKKLNTQYYNKTSVLYPANNLPADGTAVQYVALVVYMPEETGNEANYRTGEVAPVINLGINLYATQQIHEDDSFGKDYDDDAQHNYKPLCTVINTTVKDTSMVVFNAANNSVESIGSVISLDAAYEFRALDSIDTATYSDYSDWLADYYVSVDQPIEDGMMLAGYYEGYPWIAVKAPAGNYTDAVGLLGMFSTGNISNWTYADIVAGVNVFKCGVVNTNNANAGATMTVQLRLINPDNTEEYIVISETKHTFAKKITNSAELEAAIKAGETDIFLEAGEYVMPEPDLRGKTLTIRGTKDTVIDAKAVDARDQFVTGATLVFDGVTINFGKVNYMGFANTASLTYRNCDLNGLQFLFGANVAFENCNLNSNGAEHCVWTYGVQNVSFTKCNFTYGDRGINCYSDNDVAGGKQTVTFTDCTFKTENTASEGAIEINSCFFSVGIEVNVNGCTAPAYGKLAYVSPWDSTNGAKTTINIK